MRIREEEEEERQGERQNRHCVLKFTLQYYSIVQLLYVSHLLTAGRAFALIVLAVMVGPMHMYVTRWRLPAVTAAAGLRHVTRATTTTWALVTLHQRREGTSRRAPTQIAHID